MRVLHGSGRISEYTSRSFRSASEELSFSRRSRSSSEIRSDNRFAISDDSKSGSIDSTRPANTMALVENASQTEARPTRLQPSRSDGQHITAMSNAEDHENVR